MTENELDQWLDERLARLEAGEPLSICLGGLPEAEARLVMQAAQLRAIAPARPASAGAAAHRREFLRLAGQINEARMPKTSPAPRPRWLGPMLGLAALAALSLSLGLASLVGLSWLGGWVSQWRVAENPTSGPAVGLGQRQDRSAATPTAAQPTAVALNPADPQHGLVREARGLVEVQGSDGQWIVAQAGQVIGAGQRLRTRTLSSVTLVYYDGSQTELGPDSELSIDELDAQTTGARRVALTQWVGESRQAVIPSNDPGSIFQVSTPAGSGTAKGTVFHVLVTPAQLVRFDVDDGAVDVTHLDTSVLVVAGQSTIITPAQPPAEPAFQISGEGLVQEVGQTWRIADRSIVPHGNTIIFGSPQVGDWVAFEGRVMADGTRVADKIVLLRRANESQFSLAGQVAAIGAREWTVAGRAVRVDETTQIDAGLAVGERVEVTGGISQDGTWWAARIRRLGDQASGIYFRFVGVLQVQTETIWTVSGISVTVNAETQVERALVLGDIVAVEGQRVGEKTWVAGLIRRAEPADGAFEMTGVLKSLEPLVVDGLRLVTAAWTGMDAGLAAGDRVHVEGRILDDGTWLAERVERLTPEAAQAFEFVGRVNAIVPWAVANNRVAVDAGTEIEGSIAVGDLVRVEGEILPDGTWWAREIQRLDTKVGCLDLRSVVRSVEGNQLVLLDAQTISLEGVTVEGQLNVAAVVVLYGCVDADGRLQVMKINVIYQLDEVPVINVTPLPPAEDKVTLCHRPPGNPNNAHTITVGASAVPAHLAHGDTLGPCGGR